MKHLKLNSLILKSVIAPVLLALLLALAGPVSIPAARADERGPDLPPLCNNLEVPPGHEVAFHTYAVGVQIYKWDAASMSWKFMGPEAILSASANFRGKVGFHYAGPTWEGNSGSNVVANPASVVSCVPDPTAIPWLRLEAISTDGPGIFDGVTYIHRVNTTGGKMPTLPGLFDGEEKKIPYTAEYYFYRAEN